MAFETGVSLSPSDLLAKLVTRLTTDGWTIIRTNGAPGAQVSVSDPSAAEANQFNFLADDTLATASIDCQPSRADAGIGASFFAHTGSPVTSGAAGTFCSIGHPSPNTVDQGFSGTGGGHVAYFFFTGSLPDGRYAHIVVEGTTGVYFHLHFGTIEKAGTFDGGQYMHGFTTRSTGAFVWPWTTNNQVTQSTNWMRCDDFFTGIGVTTDAGLSRWFQDSGNNFQVSGINRLSDDWFSGGLINFNQRTPFGPNLAFVWNAVTPSTGTSAYNIIGHTPDLRPCSMDGREAGETVVIGSDTWHIFPIHRKTIDGTSTTTSAYLNTFSAGPAPNNDSNLAGYAYLEVP